MSPLLLATVEPHRLLDSPTFAVHFGRVAVARGLLPDGVSVEEGLAANGWRITDEPSVRIGRDPVLPSGSDHARGREEV